jgi:UDP-glucose 4-epimerase
VILVTGGSGFIGSHIVRELLKNGYEVRVFDKIKPCDEDCEWFKGDLLDEEEVLNACKDVEQVFHLAAIADVNVAISHPNLCLAVNELGTLNFLKATIAKEVDRIILASTTWVYGRRGGVVDEETPLPPPDNIYTKTKIGQEHLVMAFGLQYGLPYTILRYGIPYGPKMRKNMAIDIFVRKALRKEPITIYGDGNQGRCFIYIEDLAKASLAALKPAAKNQIFNIAGREFITINMIVEELEKNIGNKIAVEYKSPRPGDFKGAKISIEKARMMLNWFPKVDFKEGLKRYVDFVKKEVRISAE